MSISISFRVLGRGYFLGSVYDNHTNERILNERKRTRTGVATRKEEEEEGEREINYENERKKGKLKENTKGR